MTKTIFLDSRDWINLAKIATGKEDDPILKSVYKKIKKIADSSLSIFPISMFHFEDILKNSNKRQREDVIDVMLDISKGHVMKPFLLFKNQEIENAFLNKLGRDSIHDIKSQIFAKGIPFTAGLQYGIRSQNPEVQKFLDEKQDELRNIIESVGSMEKILKDESFSKYIKNDNKIYLDTAIEIEKNRKQRESMTKKQRLDYEIQSHFSNSILPHLTKFAIDNNLQDKIGNMFKAKIDFESFLESMPSSNTLVRLTHARDDESPEREVKPNDLIDVSHLSGAVPYCDVVVVEKMFASLCQRIGLDKKYDCIVLNSLKDLDKII